MGWYRFTWRDSLRASSVIAVELDRLLIAESSGKVFHSVLATAGNLGLVDISDIFYFFCSGNGESEVPGGGGVGFF